MIMGRWIGDRKTNWHLGEKRKTVVRRPVCVEVSADHKDDFVATGNQFILTQQGFICTPLRVSIQRFQQRLFSAASIQPPEFERQMSDRLPLSYVKYMGCETAHHVPSSWRC